MAERSTVDVDVRPYVSEDEQAVVDLLRTSLGEGPTGHRTLDFFRWKHEQNPFGPSYALVATHHDRVVGYRALMRWTFLSDGARVPAVRAVDTATHPDYQGRGIFRQLTMQALADLAGDAAFVFNTPNDQSRPGYLKMGWQVVGRLPLQVRIRRPLRFVQGLRNISPGMGAGAFDVDLPSAASVLEDGHAVSALVADAPQGRLVTDRSLPYLRWRYGIAPLDYRGVVIRRGGLVAGIAIVRPRMRGSLRELTLCELLVPSEDDDARRRLLAAVARVAGDHVIAHDGRLVHRDLFLSAPGVGITLTTRGIGDGSPPTDLSGWQLTLGDVELF